MKSTFARFKLAKTGKHRTPANICTMLTNVEDVWPTLYKCHTNSLCLPGLAKSRYIINMKLTVSHQTRDIKPMPAQCRLNVGPPSATPAQHQSGTGRTSGVCWEEIAKQVRIITDNYTSSERAWRLIFIRSYIFLNDFLPVFEKRYNIIQIDSAFLSNPSIITHIF